MGGLFRKLLIYICVPIYNLIVYMYKIFYSLATTRFLKDDFIQQFSSNIYVLVSAVMLFAFSITILSAIVNPDLLTDNKKGVSALFKRAIIALALMVLVPFAFNELYNIQDSVMSNSLIEKIVVGINYDCNPSTDSSCEVGGNGGQVIAGTLISSVLYPAGDEISVSEDISENYENMITKDIRNIGLIAPKINTTVEDGSKLHYHFDDDDYAFHFDGLIALIAGLITVYILTIYAIDVAVRVFKLAFLELTAPISIVAYVGVGEKMLSSWFKELGKTYGELFVRIVAIAFYLFLMNNLDEFMSAFNDGDWISVLKVFLIVGMLIFVKQVPDMLGRIFGIDIKLKGGIAGRLGSMAGVGEQAKKAWTGLTNLTKAAPLVAGAGLVVGSKAIGGKVGEKFGQTGLGQSISNNATVQKLKNGMGKTSEVGSKIKNGISSATSAVKAAANESSPFKAYDKLMYSEGGKGAVRKQQASWEKNEKAKSEARESLSKIIGANILDSNGNVVDDSLATVDNYSKMVDGMNGHTEQQRKAMTNYNSKQNKLLTAQKDNQTINQIRTAIENKMNSSSGQQKSDLSNILSNLDLGMYQTGAQLKSDLSVALAKDNFGAQFTSNISSVLDSLSNKASSLGSVDSYATNVEKAQEEFSRADSTLNDVISKATADQQVVMKEARTISKKMNEANVKSNSQVNVTNQPMQPSSSSNTSGTTSTSSSQTSSNTSRTTSSSSSQTSQSSGESLNLDLNNTKSEPLKPDDYNIQSTGGLHLNQEQVEKQKRENDVKQSIDQMERTFAPSNEDSDKPKFKLKDDE